MREHKAAFYMAPWASYEPVRPGTLRLALRPERMSGLRSNYRSMGAMFFGPGLSYEALMDRIAALEERINALAV